MQSESEAAIFADAMAYFRRATASQAEHKLQRALARARKHMQAVGEIGQLPEILSGDVDSLARQVTERAAATIGCERVNVWLFDEAETRLVCIDGWSASKKVHAAGDVLTEEQYRNEFGALKHSRYIAVDEPLSDSRTAGYVDTYLKPLGITSMLDTVIQISGKRLGLLCFEHVNRNHHWERDEIAFAEQLADKLALAVVSRTRHSVEEELRASAARFRALLDQAPDAILVYDYDAGRYIDANVSAEILFGCARAELLATGPRQFYSAAEGDAAEIKASFDAHNLRALSGEKLTFDRKLHNGHGQDLICEVHLAQLPSVEGRRLIRASFVDVSARRLAEDRLQFANTLLASEIESAPGGVLAVDTSTGLASWNTKFRKMWKLSPEVVASRDPDEILKAILGQLEQPGQTEADVARIRADPATRLDRELTLTDGRTIEWHAACLRAPSGASLGRISYFHDITARLRTEAESRESRRLLESILNAIPVRVFWKNRDLAYRGCNKSFAEDAGFFHPAQLLGKTDYDLSWRNQAALYQADDLQVIESGTPKLFIEEPQTLPDGSTSTLLTSKIPLRDAAGNIDGVLGIYMDISERKRAEEALRQSEERFRAVSETAQDAILMIDDSDKIVYWNRAAQRSLGYAANEAIGMDVREIMAFSTRREQEEVKSGELVKTGTRTVVSGVREVSARRKDGKEIPVELAASAIRLNSKRHAVAFLRDISERKQSESYIRHLARHDVLTGLPNRRVFVDALGDAMVRSRRDHVTFALLYLDLDHFKDINDTLGHPVGDLVLQEVAKRLLAVARETDTVARFGGDEFAILQTGLADPADAAAFAERILTSLTAPMILDGNEIRTGTSVGIAIYDEPNGDAEKLLSQADVALYRAKSEGRGTFRYFTESMDVEVHTRVRLGSELRQALASDQLFLMYQPQVDMDSGRIVGVEALVRWRHPERGLISPADFIPIAEKTGLIVALGHWVLQRACRQARAWLDAGIAPTLMAVNLSGLQFKSPHELESWIATTLAETGLLPQHLELELTESMLMDASQEHNDVLLRLRKSGLRLAIDDFGTGYSSLDYLRRFPVDRIKIAQTFIAELTRNNGDAAIVKAALSLARELHLPVIVEGVETAAQLALLKEWGCREVQGYYYSRPLLPEDIAPLLRAGVIIPA